MNSVRVELIRSEIVHTNVVIHRFPTPKLLSMQGIFVRFILISMCIQSAHAQVIGRFEQADMDGWKVKRFKGETQYTLSPAPNGHSLKAYSEASASALYKKVEIDLTKSPYLNWSWRITRPLSNVDETTKQGDDYVARVYVVVSKGLFSMNTLALSYVWSGHQEQGTLWPNAFTEKAAMIAVRSGTKDAGQWLTEKRNVREDFKRAFGRDIKKIDGVALMTDTDNSNQSAIAWYGNIRFTAQ